VSGRGPHYLLTFAFLAVIGSVGPWQAVSELRDGQSPQCLDLLGRMPSVSNLRTFESDLEDRSVLAGFIRPLMQQLRFTVFQDAGEKAIFGRDGWWFYRPDVRFLTEDCPDDHKNRTGPGPAVEAIVAFREQLAARGIHLVVVPVPGKPSVYPDKLTGRALPGDPRIRKHTSNLLDRLADAGIETINLLTLFAEARSSESGSSDAKAVYLQADTHWTNAGVQLAAGEVARRIRELGWAPAGAVDYDLETVRVRRAGDVIRMLDCPPVEALFDPQEVVCHRVVRRIDGQPYRDDPGSAILVLGDSFLRIYERDEPGSAGFIAHLARHLRQQLTSIVNDGGASTLVRQELSRKSALLETKKLVIWEFVERDIRFGMEGWQDVAIGGAAR
jgi:hypothetical protein